MFMFNQITTNNLRGCHVECEQSFMLNLYIINLREELGSCILVAPVVTFTFKSEIKSRQSDNRTKLLKYNPCCLSFIVASSCPRLVNTLSIFLHNSPVELGLPALSAVG